VLRAICSNYFKIWANGSRFRESGLERFGHAFPLSVNGGVISDHWAAQNQASRAGLSAMALSA